MNIYIGFLLECNRYNPMLSSSFFIESWEFFSKILKKCFLGIDSRVWVITKWLCGHCQETKIHLCLPLKQIPFVQLVIWQSLYRHRAAIITITKINNSTIFSGNSYAFVITENIVYMFFCSITVLNYCCEKSWINEWMNECLCLFAQTCVNAQRRSYLEA